MLAQAIGKINMNFRMNAISIMRIAMPEYQIVSFLSNFFSICSICILQGI